MIEPRRPQHAAIATAIVALALVVGACASQAEETAGEHTNEATEDAATGVGRAADAAPTTTAPLAVEPAATEPVTDTTAPPPPPDQRPLPQDEAAMIAALDEAELAVRDNTLATDTRAAWGRRQQALYRVLSENQDWAPAALAGTDPRIQSAVDLNWSARQNLSSLVNTETLHDELPAWRVEPPAPAEELLGYYKQAEETWGIEWEYLAAINLIETRMGRIHGVSTAGAVGPMQFLPTTWAECCEGDPTQPSDAIPGAAKYLTIRGGPENMPRAIWGYNNSDYYVDAVSAYANVLMADEEAYHGYHAWEIYFLSTEGLVRIPVGYDQPEPILVTEWLATNPDARFGTASMTDEP